MNRNVDSSTLYEILDTGRSQVPISAELHEGDAMSTVINEKRRTIGSLNNLLGRRSQK